MTHQRHRLINWNEKDSRYSRPSDAWMYLRHILNNRYPFHVSQQYILLIMIQYAAFGNI